MAKNEIDPQDLDAQEATEGKLSTVRRLKRHREIEDFKWLMGTRQGRRIVWRLLEKAGVFHTTFRTTGEGDFLEGMRNMGLILITEINETCPEKYFLMVKEQQDNEHRASSASN